MSTPQNSSGFLWGSICPGVRMLHTTLDILTKETYNQFGNVGQTIFFLGDGVQRATVDGIFNLLSPQTYTPANLLRLTSLTEKQAVRISALLTSPEMVGLAVQELRNKLEAFVLVKGLNTILGLPDNQFLPLPPLVEKAYNRLTPFQVLWGVEGLGHYYADSYWRTFGRPAGLLLEKNVSVPAKSLLMLHAGMGLCFGDRLLGIDTPNLTVNSPPSLFRSAVQEFMRLAKENSREGYLGPVIESLGLVTRDFYPDMLPRVSQAVAEVAPELQGYFWHGAGRALYFSRRYFVPALSTVWSGIDTETRIVSQQLSAMAGLAWGFTLVNMRQPEIIETAVENLIVDSPLQEGFSNGVTSTTIMRQDISPDAPFIKSFYSYRPKNPKLSALWNRLVAIPAQVGVNQYYPILKEHIALGEVFRYQDLGELVTRLKGRPIGGSSERRDAGDEAVRAGTERIRPIGAGQRYQ